MGESFGFLVSDAIVLWRCRELVSAGKLELRGDLARLADAQLRRTAR
jgi:hypothetical protein